MVILYICSQRTPAQSKWSGGSLSAPRLRWRVRRAGCAPARSSGPPRGGRSIDLQCLPGKMSICIQAVRTPYSNRALLYSLEPTPLQGRVAAGHAEGEGGRPHGTRGLGLARTGGHFSAFGIVSDITVLSIQYFSTFAKYGNIPRTAVFVFVLNMPAGSCSVWAAG